MHSTSFLIVQFKLFNKNLNPSHEFVYELRTTQQYVNYEI